MIGILGLHLLRAHHSAWPSNCAQGGLTMFQPLLHCSCALYQVFGKLIKLQLMTSSPLKHEALPRNASIICYLHFSKLLKYSYSINLVTLISDSPEGYCS